ncbi:MAG: GGDEF domain-containing protein [Proteobacteria bacterium]|nr:GGDEF domain-containing protein [Pseudomonadota bacterium]
MYTNKTTRGGLRLASSSAQPIPQPGRYGDRTNMEDEPTSAADYSSRIEGYAKKIRKTTDVGDIISLLEDALRETHALHTANEVEVVRQQVVLAENRIERLKAELELVNKLVREDQLTGALNRRGLDDALLRESARADRSNSDMCIALIDLDNFKRFNDTFGHQAGDAVLAHLVAVVKETVRSNDLIGRYGGEEFLLILPDASMEEAAAVMNRLQRGLAARPVPWGTGQLEVTFSAGLARRRPGENEAALINHADQALYEAKRVGKNRIIVAS